jgi:hypothetical protein
MTTQAAFRQGVIAFRNEEPDTANPYDHGTDEHAAWNDGYNQAAEE